MTYEQIEFFQFFRGERLEAFSIFPISGLLVNWTKLAFTVFYVWKIFQSCLLQKKLFHHIYTELPVQVSNW